MSVHQTCLGATLLACALSAQAGPNWSGLWRTPDQQAEAHLQAGDAATAARTYTDPKRRAYAELKAGQYQAAAKDYAPFHDRDALYNRGNALAHAGELQQALQAYDEALKQDPKDQQARRNRDLVAKALQQQKQQQQQNQDKDKQGQQGKSGQQGQDGQPGQKDAPPQQSKASSSPTQSGLSAPQSAGDASRDPAHPSGAKPPSNDKQPGASASSPSAQDDAAQAKKEMADMQQGQAPNKPQGNGSDQGTHARREQPRPRTEQNLAESQWLRRIPDDPGGLLRRKFLIQHLLKHPENQP